MYVSLALFYPSTVEWLALLMKSKSRMTFLLFELKVYEYKIQALRCRRLEGTHV